jgi:cupin fold WbuC family metalloprotein
MKLFDSALFDDLAAKAAASPRQRAHYNVHAASSDLVQRFLVCANRNSYVRPHRHMTKSELGVVLRGGFDVVTFDDSGVITGRHRVGAGSTATAFETPRIIWHTLVPDSDGSLFFEVKEGPYDAATASQFAPWSPAEGDANAAAFLSWVRTAPVGAQAPVF